MMQQSMPPKRYEQVRSSVPLKKVSSQSLQHAFSTSAPLSNYDEGQSAMLYFNQNIVGPNSSLAQSSFYSHQPQHSNRRYMNPHQLYSPMDMVGYGSHSTTFDIRELHSPRVVMPLNGGDNMHSFYSNLPQSQPAPIYY